MLQLHTGSGKKHVDPSTSIQTLGNVVTTDVIARTVLLHHDFRSTDFEGHVMANTNQRRESAFFEAFRRPAWIVMMAAQMLLGLGLALALIVKYYMMIFGTESCTTGGLTLGNSIRCTSTLEIVAHFVIAVSGIRFAAFMFSDTPRNLLAPLFIGLTGVLLLFLSGLSLATVSWPVAAVILTLLSCGSAVFFAQRVLQSQASNRE
ncbi:MAG: hypothetical protein ABJJ37_04750 [Roseibium sp.]